MLRDINQMRPIRNSPIEIVDLQNLTTFSADASGLTCTATLLASNGERVNSTVRLYISQLGEVLIEVRPL